MFIPVGRIAQLWRYPVKSFAGEQLTTVLLDRQGVLGDRAWAILDLATGEISGGKRFPKLMACSARYLVPPATPDEVAHVAITLPDGQQVRSTDEEAATCLSALVGHDLRLSPRAPASDRAYYRRRKKMAPAAMRHALGIAPSEPFPDFSVYPLRALLAFGKYVTTPGTHLDAFPIHLLTTATLEMVRGADPASDPDVRRFRPNLLIETDSAWSGHVEEQWLGGLLRIGDVELRVDYPTVRCAMPGQAQPGLAKNPQLLRTLARTTGRFLGGYASVRRDGNVHEGDPVHFQPVPRTWWSRSRQALAGGIKRSLLKLTMR